MSNPLPMFYLRQIGGHPVQVFLEQAIAHEKRQHLADPLRVTYPSYDLEAVYLGHDALTPVAAMSFERKEWGRIIQVAFAFVAPEYRRQGHHTRLFAAVRAIALRDGYLRIHRSVASGNASMIEAIERQGGKLQHLDYVVHLAAYGSQAGSIDNRYELAGCGR